MDDNEHEQENDIDHDYDDQDGGFNDSKKKFTQSEWLATERILPEHQRNVLNALVEYALNGNDVLMPNAKYCAIGEDHYLKHRDKLVNKKLVQKLKMQHDTNQTCEKKKSKKQKETNKADKIREQNNMKIIDNAIIKAFELVNMEQYINQNENLRSEYLEIRGIAFIYLAYCCFVESISIEIEDIYEIIAGLQKFTKEYKNLIDFTFKNKMTLSETLYCDMEWWINKLVNEKQFSVEKVFDIAPRLICNTIYDNSIPHVGISPRKHQQQLHDAVLNSLNSGSMIRYHAAIGSGKTYAMNVLLGAAAKKIIDAGGRCIILSVCHAKSVQLTAGNILYNANLPFAMAFNNSEDPNGFTITNSNSCREEPFERIAVIVANTNVAYKILRSWNEQNLMNEYGVILCFDEPTIGADIKHSNELHENMKILTELPKNVILSSATLPPATHLKQIIDSYKAKYSTAEFIDIFSDETHIGCDMISFTGNLVVPHLGTKTSTELERIIFNIKESPLFGRLYTSAVLKNLHYQMTNTGIQDIPSINSTNISEMNNNNVRKQSMDLLRILSKQSNHVITKVCSSKLMPDVPIIKQINKDSVTDDDPDDVFVFDDADDDEPIIDATNIDLHKLGTQLAWKFTNGTIVATNNPVQFARTYFADLVKDIYSTELVNNTTVQKGNSKKQSNDELTESDIELSKMFQTDDSNDNVKVKSIKHILQLYEAKLKIYNNMKERIYKRFDNEKKMNDELDALEEMRPFIEFPEDCCINTFRHIERYAKSYSDNIKSSHRTRGYLEGIPVNSMSVDDFITALLFAGVGIYAKNTTELDQTYLSTVLTMAHNGELAYLIADDSICYGTDFSINNIIISDDFAEKHSVSSIMQYIGRAGRVGQSWRAFGYVSDNVGKRIIEYIRNMNDSIVEAQNMTDEFNNIRIKKINDLDKQYEMIKQKYNVDGTLKKMNIEFVSNKKPEPIVEKPKLPIVNLSTIIASNKKPITNATDNSQNNDTDWRKKNNNKTSNNNSYKPKSTDTKLDNAQKTKPTENKSDVYKPPHTKNNNKSANKTESKSADNDMNWRKK